MKNVVLVLGTSRKGRESEKVAKYLLRLFEARSDIALTYVDVRDYVHTPETVPPWGIGGVKEKPTKWQEVVTKSDTLVFVLPEYNHGYPGEWKLLMDTLYREYKDKKAYIVSVSDGVFSGVRVADHVKPVLVELGLSVKKTALHVGHVDSLFSKDGTPNDESFQERAATFVDAVCELA